MRTKGGKMERNDLTEFNTVVYERLGRLYNRNPEYQKCVEEEKAMFEKLRGRFNEEELLLIQEYHNLTYNTMSICEILAYRQGMRDHAGILGIESKGV